jgi:hypothetical protein
MVDATTELVKAKGFTISYGDNDAFENQCRRSVEKWNREHPHDRPVDLKEAIGKDGGFDTTYGLTDSYLKEMLLKDDMHLWLQCRVMMHEYGHVLQPDDYKRMIALVGCNDVIEHEAEFCSYFVLKHFGLAYWPTVWSYLFGWSYTNNKSDYYGFMQKASRMLGQTYKCMPPPKTFKECDVFEDGLPFVSSYLKLTVPQVITELEDKGIKR